MKKWFRSFKNILTPQQYRKDTLQTFREFGKTSRRWWGAYQVEAGQSRFWRVGNVIIGVDRLQNEWHIASSEVHNIGKEVIEKIPEDHDHEENFTVPKDSLNFKTFTFKTQAEITLSPILADRPLSSKLERSLYIPGGEEILLYISSPVWVKVETGKTNIILDEIPTSILSDTWFSHNTLEGELCYAGHTYCSPHLEDIPSGPDRIISPMLLKNRSRAPLMLEKISIPLPFLSVYSDSDNFLWTEQLNVYRVGGDHPEVRVAKGPPKALEAIQRLNPPRRDIPATSSLKKFFNITLRNN